MTGRGFSRASRRSCRRKASCIASGIQMAVSTPTAVPQNRSGATPTIVYRSPLIVMEVPAMAGFPPNRVRQMSWLMTATGWARGAASS